MSKFGVLKKIENLSVKDLPMSEIIWNRFCFGIHLIKKSGKCICNSKLNKFDKNPLTQNY